MTLHEKRSTKHNQSQWHAHFERERQQLSASVTETLIKSSTQDEMWEDEQQLPVPDENVTLIPPLLSLQSKMLPAVRRNETGHSLTGMHSIVDSNEEQKTVSQNTSMLKRIVQRLGVPFAARNASSPSDGNDSHQLGYERHEKPEKQTTAQLPMIVPMEKDVPPEWRNQKSSAVVDAVPSAYAPSYPLPQPTQSTTSKHRLAGHTTKIRLETTPMPAIVLPLEAAEPSKPPVLPSEVREPLDIVLRSIPSEKKTTHITAIHSTAPQERGVTEQIKPVSNTMCSEVGVVTRGSFSGSGMFASGQRDLMVKNTNITASSVVLVMLTANPGPVAVHYVTPQPEVGFTIHLTGPTTVKAPFNYVILLGELF